MIRIKNGEILDYKLPRTGTLKNGETVSNYNKLSRDVLLAEGWKELEDIKPEYDAEKEYLVPVKYEELHDKVIKEYEIKRFADLPISEELKTESLMAAVRNIIRVDELSPEELEKLIYVYPQYEVAKEYLKGDLFVYDGNLYEVISKHTSQEDWRPDQIKSLYLNKLPENVIPEWVQPTGAHDAYSIGDKVIFKGEVYESTIDSNVWSTDYSQGWKKVE